MILRGGLPFYILTLVLLCGQCKPSLSRDERKSPIDVKGIIMQEFRGSGWICQTGDDPPFDIDNGWGKIFSCEFGRQAFGDFLVRVRLIERVGEKDHELSSRKRFLEIIRLEHCELLIRPNSVLSGNHTTEEVRTMFNSWFAAVAVRASAAGCGLE